MTYKMILDVQDPIIKPPVIQRVEVIQVAEVNNPDDKQQFIEIQENIAGGLILNWIAAYSPMPSKRGTGYYGLFLGDDTVLFTDDIAKVIDWKSAHNCECLVEIPEDDLLEKDVMNSLNHMFQLAQVGITATSKTYGETWDKIDELLESIGAIATKITKTKVTATLSYGTVKFTMDK